MPRLRHRLVLVPAASIVTAPLRRTSRVPVFAAIARLVSPPSAFTLMSFAPARSFVRLGRGRKKNSRISAPPVAPKSARKCARPSNCNYLGPISPSRAAVVTNSPSLITHGLRTSPEGTPSRSPADSFPAEPMSSVPARSHCLRWRRQRQPRHARFPRVAQRPGNKSSGPMALFSR